MGFWKGWRSRPVAKYRVEPRDVQLKIIRTHIAAMTGEISNLRTMLEVEFSRARSLMEGLEVRMDGINESHSQLVPMVLETRDRVCDK